MKKKTNKKAYKEDTELVHMGSAPDEYFGIVNTPVVRASSIIFPTLAAYEGTGQKFRYGRSGTPLSDKFEQTITKLEGGYGAISAPSGLTAIVTVLMAFLKAGDHILITDSLYPFTRKFCMNVLPRFGVEVEFYDPLIGKGIENLVRKNTAVIYMESPGSATFEIQDVDGIVKVAKKKNIVTVFDNSWSAGVLFKPLSYGVDIVLQSATKYIGGHSDIMLGVAVAGNEKNYKRLKTTAVEMGVCAGSEELYLALRGLRTVKLRLKQHAVNTLIVAKWLEKRKEVQRVYYPALPSDPNHALWKKYYKGANGLMGVLLKPASKAAVTKFIESLELFPIASSWGGYESLLQPQSLISERKAVPWKEKGTLIRLHVGLEDPDDLIGDLERAFRAF